MLVIVHCATAEHSERPEHDQRNHHDLPEDTGLGELASCDLELCCHRALVHTISFARVRFRKAPELRWWYVMCDILFLRICYMLCNLLIGCRQKYLHVAYSHLPIVLKYRTDMLYSGYLGFGGLNLELLSPTTCIYSQNVSTANKHWIWGGLWLSKCIYWCQHFQ